MKRTFFRLAPYAFVALLGACTTTNESDKLRDFTVYFETDSADLTPTAQQVVAQAAARAHDTKTDKIVVSGRADGGTPRDAALADQRATVVMQALSKQGVPAAEIEKQPDAPSSSRTGVAAHQVIVTLLP